MGWPWTPSSRSTTTLSRALPSTRRLPSRRRRRWRQWWRCRCRQHTSTCCCSSAGTRSAAPAGPPRGCLIIAPTPPRLRPVSLLAPPALVPPSSACRTAISCWTAPSRTLSCCEPRWPCTRRPASSATPTRASAARGTSVSALTPSRSCACPTQAATRCSARPSAWSCWQARSARERDGDRLLPARQQAH